MSMPGSQRYHRNLNPSPRFKNSRNNGSGASCRWTLFTAWALEFKLHLIFHRGEFKNRFNILFDRCSWSNWRISSFYENKTKHWALFSTKTNQGQFYFHWAEHLKSSRRSCSCQSRDTSCCMSWVEDWILESGLRSYDSSRSFQIAGSGFITMLCLKFQALDLYLSILQKYRTQRTETSHLVLQYASS